MKKQIQMKFHKFLINRFLIPNYLLFFILVLSSCQLSKNDKLKDDKTRLVKLQSQLDELKGKIGALQDTIKKEGGKDSIKTTKVVVMEAKPAPFKHYVEVEASIYGQDNINASPGAPGVVKSIYVAEGNYVTKGTAMAALDDAVLLENIREVQSQLDLAKTLYDKQKGLWDQKIGTEVQYLTAKNNYESLKTRLAGLQQQDDMTKIKSPIDGTVDNVKIKIGESVAPGMPSIQVVNTNQLMVKGNVAEAFISSIHPGDSLRIFFPDLQKEIASTAFYVSKGIDIVNRTFTVEVKLPQNPDYHPNMIAMLKIMDYSTPSSLSVPVNLIQTDPTGTFIFIAKNENGIEVARKEPVKTGKVYNGIIQITDGLNLGDKVITVGYDDLNNGDAISY